MLVAAHLRSPKSFSKSNNMIKTDLCSAHYSKAWVLWDQKHSVFFTSKNCLCSLVHNENSSTFIKSAEIFEAKQKWGQINSMCEYERDCCLFSQTLADTNTVSTHRKKQTHPTPQSNKTKPIQHSSCDTFTAIASFFVLLTYKLEGKKY